MTNIQMATVAKVVDRSETCGYRWEGIETSFQMALLKITYNCAGMAFWPKSKKWPFGQTLLGHFLENGSNDFSQNLLHLSPKLELKFDL